jgi:hypothetical protein
MPWQLAADSRALFEQSHWHQLPAKPKSSPTIVCQIGKTIGEPSIRSGKLTNEWQIFSDHSCLIRAMA